MNLYAAILATLVAQTPFTLEQEAPAERQARLGMLAKSIDQAAHTRREAVALMTIAVLESRLAAYVQDGRCEKDERPAGAADCDHGLAATPFQLRRSACPVLWTLPEGSQAWLDAGAECAVRLWRYGEITCHSVAGAFGIYAGRSCTWMGGYQRQVEFTRIEARFERARKAAK